MSRFCWCWSQTYCVFVHLFFVHFLLVSWLGTKGKRMDQRTKKIRFWVGIKGKISFTHQWSIFLKKLVYPEKKTKTKTRGPGGSEMRFGKRPIICVHPSFKMINWEQYLGSWGGKSARKGAKNAVAAEMIYWWKLSWIDDHDKYDDWSSSWSSRWIRWSWW